MMLAAALCTAQSAADDAGPGVAAGASSPVVVPPLSAAAQRGTQRPFWFSRILSESHRLDPPLVRQDASGAGYAFARMRQARRRSAEQPSIIVWPEVPAPFYYYNDPRLPRFGEQPGARHRRVRSVRNGGAYAAGAPLNSAELVSPHGIPSAATTRCYWCLSANLCPGPSGSPTRSLPRWAISRRATESWSLPYDHHGIGTFICYESVFPNLVRRFVAAGAEVLFNISNDGWFRKDGGATPASEDSSACAPPKTAAGSCDPPTTASPPPSTRRDDCAAVFPHISRQPPARATRICRSRPSIPATATGSR